MANKTNNYKLPKPEADDFYDISVYNKTMDILDDSLTEMKQKKLDKNGDASEAVTEFEQEVLRENIESGETLSTTFGKVKKWFSEMKDVAFSGHAKDVATDAGHRFVSDAEKSSWNGKVGASGGDISETVISSLQSIATEFPIPNQGEQSNVFLGKVKKFIQDFNDFKAGIITVGKLANNGNTTSEGYALDARYGKSLFDLYSKLNADIGERLFFGVGTALQTKAGTTWYRIQINPNDTAGIFKSIDNGITWPIFERFITSNDLSNIHLHAGGITPELTFKPANLQHYIYLCYHTQYTAPGKIEHYSISLISSSWDKSIHNVSLQESDPAPAALQMNVDYDGLVTIKSLAGYADISLIKLT